MMSHWSTGLCRTGPLDGPGPTALCIREDCIRQAKVDSILGIRIDSLAGAGGVRALAGEAAADRGPGGGSSWGRAGSHSQQWGDYLIQEVIGSRWIDR